MKKYAWALPALSFLPCIVTGCYLIFPEESDGHVLIIAVANDDDQSASSEFGKQVNIQSRGGQTLIVRTTDGVHKAASHEKTKTASCIPIAGDETELTITPLRVIPNGVECTLDVQLLEEKLSPDTEPSGEKVCEGNGTAIASQTRPIRIESVNDDVNGQGGSVNAGGMGGMPQATGSSSSAGGAENGTGGMGGGGK